VVCVKIRHREVATSPSPNQITIKGSKMTQRIISQKELKRILHYCPETGVFTWIAQVGNRIKIGDAAGNLSVYGYMEIQIHNVRYTLHRLAFLYMTGEFPELQVDHINQIRDDNRWGNLRDVSFQENKKNCTMYSNNSSGTTGVYWDKRRKKWYATIANSKTNKFLGYFEAKQSAINARSEANKEYGYHVNHGS